MITPIPPKALPTTSNVRFGNAVNQTVNNFAHQLSGMQRIPITNTLKQFDFKERGMATIPQLMLIYGTCIASRIYNSARRSKNELREEITRDSMGYSFWFFGTPILQRVFLKFFAPDDYRKALLEIKQNPTSGPFANLSTRDKLRSLNWRFNPLTRYGLPSSKQVKEQKELALRKMEQAGYHPLSPEFSHIENYYKNLVKWRNFATGLGYIVTVGLLGIGINLYNIHITKKKMALAKQRAAAQTPTAFTAPVIA